MHAPCLYIYIYIHYIIHIHTPPAPPPSRAFIHARHHRHRRRRHRSPLFFRRVVKIDNFSHLPYRPTTHVDLHPRPTPPRTTPHPWPPPLVPVIPRGPTAAAAAKDESLLLIHSLFRVPIYVSLFVFPSHLSAHISPSHLSLALFLSQGVIICAVYILCVRAVREEEKRATLYLGWSKRNFLTSGVRHPCV